MSGRSRSCIRGLEELGPDSLGRLDEVAAADVVFRDPFSGVRGREEMKRAFARMFEAVGPVAFKVERSAADGGVPFMSWRFSGVLRGRPCSFDGAGVVAFAPDSLVRERVDHRDAAAGFHEKLPVIGWLPRRIRRRIGRH